MVSHTCCTHTAATTSEEKTLEPSPTCASIEFPQETQDKWYNQMLNKVTEKKEDYGLWRVEENKLWKTVVTDQPHLEEDTWRLVLPKELRRKAIKECHNPPTCGHHKTFKRMQQKFYWPKMRKDVASYISRCQICQRTKYDQTRPAGMMGELRSVDVPWKMIAADFIGPLPRSLKGF